MAKQRPDLQEGYLGGQSKFYDFGLGTMSHKEPEITINDNSLEVLIQTTQPMKIMASLINAETKQEYPENVFTQTKGSIVIFLLTLPESGYYKMQIYALPAKDDGKSLPGVFNYLINCTRALQSVYPFPKQYSIWKEGCYLGEPLTLHKDSKLVNVFFKVIIPNAKSVAIVCSGDWSHLKKGDNNMWEGKVEGLNQHRGKDTKVTLNAQYGDDETKFSTLLEYRI